MLSRWYPNRGLEVSWRLDWDGLSKLLNAILRSGRMPIKWRKSSLIPFYKKHRRCSDQCE